MQLLTATDEPSSEDIEPDSFSVTIIPTASAPPATATNEPNAVLTTEDKPEQTPVQALFNALSDCANLHPDPLQEDEDGDQGSRLIRSGLAIPGDDTGGLPPPMPGSGGWITAENMHEFIDENGNWIEGDNESGNEGDDGQSDEPLGPGAGNVRARDDRGADGNENSGDETKWQRTS
jgi:chloride channel, nucleotide-sensitive, 1A